MIKQSEILNPDLVAPSLHSESDKPSISGTFNIMEHYKNLSLENIDSEIWLPSVSFYGYDCSNMGRIKSLGIYGNYKTPRIMKQKLHPTGYLYLCVYLNKKRNSFRVHREIAKTFIPNPENKQQVNHIKGIKHDNRVSELEWATASEDAKHKFKIGLQSRIMSMVGRFGLNNPKSKTVVQKDLDGNIIRIIHGMSEAQRITGVPQQNICKVCLGQRNQAGGFKWEYA